MAGIITRLRGIDDEPVRRRHGQAVDDRVGPVVRVFSAWSAWSAWSVDKARDLSWVTAETV